MGRRGTARRRLATVLVGAVAASVLAACGGDDGGTPTLVWYTNPDAGGQAAVAEKCSTDEYKITTQVLPQNASEQRIQLIRRLAAEDPEIDLMSLDPPFTAEFAEAGYLADIPEDLKSTFSEQAFDGAVEAATWDDELVVAPFWSNTQVLWFRKSFAQKAGLDMTKPVTWDQIIDAASQNDGKIGVQANKYEGYAVWINALITGAGGQIAEDTDKGADADITIDDEAGLKAAEIIESLASSPAAPGDLSVSNEGTAGATFGSEQGSFLVNWTYIWTNYDETQPEVKQDLGFARYPQSVEGEESRPPYGGIGIGVSKFSDDRDEALAALECLTDAESQGINAEMTGNMPSSPAGYDYPALAEIYPQELLDLFQESLDAAAPRTPSPYWSDISGALQTTWHPPSGVDQQTPKESAEFITEILRGEGLL